MRLARTKGAVQAGRRHDTVEHAGHSDSIFRWFSIAGVVEWTGRRVSCASKDIDLRWMIDGTLGALFCSFLFPHTVLRVALPMDTLL